MGSRTQGAQVSIRDWIHVERDGPQGLTTFALAWTWAESRRREEEEEEERSHRAARAGRLKPFSRCGFRV